MRSASPAPRRLLPVLMTALAMATMDNSIVAVAMRTVQKDLHTTGGGLQLALLAFPLGFAVTVVTGARLGDAAGHTRVFAAGLAGFTAASLVCGLAPTVTVLIVARLLQGASGGLMVPQVLSVIQLALTGAARARAIAVYSTVLAIGVAAGQIAGGVIVSADLFGAAWRPAFLINVPVGVALLVCTRGLLPAGRRAASARLDVAGALLLAAAMAAIVAALAIGREHRWPAWSWSALAAGFGSLVLLSRYERRLVARGGWPLVDPRALRRPGMRLGLLAACLVNFGYAGLLFVVSLYVQDALGFSPLHGGLTFLPYPVGFALVSLMWTRVPDHRRAALPLTGTLLFAVAIGALAAASHRHWPVVAAAVCLLVAGAGHAAGFSPQVERIASAADPESASAVSGLVSVGALLASVASVAMTGSIYLNWAAGSPARPGDGLLAAALAIDVALIAAAVCAGGAAAARGGLPREPSPPRVAVPYQDSP